MSIIIINISINTILDFDSGDISFGFRIANDDLLRLTYVNSGIGGTKHVTSINQNIVTRNRIESIAAIGGISSITVSYTNAQKSDAIGIFYFNAIAFWVFNSKIVEPYPFEIASEDTLTARRLSGKSIFGSNLKWVWFH